MANGNNRKFLSDPRDFLRNKILEINVRASELTRIAANMEDDSYTDRAAHGRIGGRGGAVGGDGSVASGIFEFDIFKTEKQAKRRTSTLGIGHNTSVTVYELKSWGQKDRDMTVTHHDDAPFEVTYRVPTKAHPVRAYWAPWSPNSCWTVRLGDEADYFFTPTMDGCSVAISHGDAPYVTHGNYRDPHDPTRVSEAATLHEMDQHHHGLGSDVDRRLAYSDYAATAEDKEEGLNNLVTLIGIREHGAWNFFYQRRRINAATPNTGIVLTDRLVRI